MASQWDNGTADGTLYTVSNTAILSFGKAGTDDVPQPLSFALRDGNARDSKLLWSAPLDAEDPMNMDDLQFAIGAIRIPLTIDSA